jgi:hypothetical protein
MSRMVLGGQILPAPGVVGPVRQAGGREVQAGGNLPLERIPGGVNVRRPEDGSIALRACVRVAGENQRPAIGLVFAESVIERGGVEERVDVEELRAGTDV